MFYIAPKLPSNCQYNHSQANFAVFVHIFCVLSVSVMFLWFTWIHHIRAQTPQTITKIIEYCNYTTSQMTLYTITITATIVIIISNINNYNKYTCKYVKILFLCNIHHETKWIFYQTNNATIDKIGLWMRMRMYSTIAFTDNRAAGFRWNDALWGVRLPWLLSFSQMIPSS